MSKTQLPIFLLIVIYTTIIVFITMVSSNLTSFLENNLFITNFKTEKSQTFVVTDFDSESQTMLFQPQDENYLLSTILEDRGNVIGLYFSQEIIYQPELATGRFFSEEDFYGSQAKAVIGSDLINQLTNLQGKDYYTFNHQRFEVIGILKSNLDNEWKKNKVYLDMSKLTFGNLENREFQFNSKQKTSFDSFKRTIQGSDNIAIIPYDKTNNFFHNLLGFQPVMMFSSILVIICFVLNTLLSSQYWLDSLKIEIGVRKSVGSSDWQIGLKILKRFFGYFVISLGLGLVFSWGLNLFLWKKNDINSVTIILTLLILVVTSVLTFLVSLWRIRQAPPVQLMKGVK